MHVSRNRADRPSTGLTNALIGINQLDANIWDHVEGTDDQPIHMYSQRDVLSCRESRRRVLCLWSIAKCTFPVMLEKCFGNASASSISRSAIERTLLASGGFWQVICAVGQPVWLGPRPAGFLVFRGFRVLRVTLKP